MRCLVAILALLLAMPFGFAQQDSPKPAPGESNRILGPTLIAWSELQKPQPVPQKPQPLPPPETPEQQSTPAQQPEQSQPDNGQQREPDAQQAVSRTFTGTIAKIEGKYVIQTSDGTAYPIDDQDKARPYEGKRVRVVGNVDRATGIVHISSIELIS
ncbi:MAG TPA: DUF5818 domain-containing protein [Candidatus Sulfotelmatobacter sp.]|nr:DUF5818 domain-containing protein [Candidatus Sulfotelmatobacter sp.]